MTICVFSSFYIYFQLVFQQCIFLADFLFFYYSPRFHASILTLQMYGGTKIFYVLRAPTGLNLALYTVIFKVLWGEGRITYHCHMIILSSKLLINRSIYQVLKNVLFDFWMAYFEQDVRSDFSMEYFEQDVLTDFSVEYFEHDLMKSNIIWYLSEFTLPFRFCENYLKKNYQINHMIFPSKEHILHTISSKEGIMPKQHQISINRRCDDVKEHVGDVFLHLKKGVFNLNEKAAHEDLIQIHWKQLLMLS